MKRFLSALSSLVVLSSLALVLGGSPALAAGTDCDSNAVIRCGVSSADEISQKMSSSGVSEVFSCFGISPQEANAMGTTAVNGTVTARNTVLVNGKVVATHAMTAGRQNIAGSTQISCGGRSFFMRPPSVSFASSPLPAFVVMQNDRFAFAVIKSCGNPVKATPVVVRKKPAPAPQTTAPAPPAPPAQQQQQQQQQTVVINAPQPVQQQQQPAQAQTQSAPAEAKQLPNTGPGELATGASLLATVSGTAGHLVYRRLKR